MTVHLALQVLGTDPPGTQPVEVLPLSGGLFRILRSPGLVEGIAAGDVVELLPGTDGQFKVAERGGNIAIKVTCPEAVRPAQVWLTDRLGALGGRCDGAVRTAAVFTVPASSGFSAIEAVMERLAELEPGAVWWYGNVYADDGETPLDWWAQLTHRQGDSLI